MVDKELPNGEAERLINSPLMNEIFDGFEHNYQEIIINTEIEYERNKSILAIRAIRDLRQKLKSLAEGETKLSETIDVV